MVTKDQELAGDKHRVYLCILPMFHVFGLAVIVYGQLQMGNTLVSTVKLEFEAFFRNAEKYRETNLWVVPPIVLAMAKQNVVKKFDLSSLKEIGSGAAPLGKELMEECAKKFPQAVVMQIISTQNAEPLPPNQLGEIWVRGSNMMQGDVTRVASSIEHSWKYYVSNMSRSYPDDEAGEVPVAYVVRSPNSWLTEEDVGNFIAKQVAPFKRLRKVTFINSVPKSASGKILRRQLVAQVRSKM
ncbi:AMP-dependent synthetase and ligase family protein isoform 2 [Hibiscus syriacus]|uniref:AMP-dependent synthetase and ligase family protein isoform 2 n=1 Tax=Hibiscus syriacus TaxID=106335 RepID=A0A6A3B9A9_HIBSY|nr:AMP-dependent synthetase and ligase family protein isoform 2 [Hibiscus syriacus]